MIAGPPFSLALRHRQRQMVRDEEGTYPTLEDDIEEWAMENLKYGWTVKTGTRFLNDEEKARVDPELHGALVKTSWIEFHDYKDWLLFKLRWCDQ